MHRKLVSLHAASSRSRTGRGVGPATIATVGVAAIITGCGASPDDDAATNAPGRPDAAETASGAESSDAAAPGTDAAPDRSASPASATPDTAGATGAAARKPWFVDVTAASGIDFVHDPGITGTFAYPEAIGAGVALIDFDADGDLDVYLVQGGLVPGDPDGAPQPNRLFRNDGAMRFVDVTESSGTGDVGYGMGAWVVDIEGDGDEDLFVTNVGPDVLYLNEGNGRFRDATAGSGLGDDGFSLGAAFFDADADGDLDLYLTRYVEWSYGADPVCWSHGSVRDYCGPSMYDGAEDRLYLNRGDGTFDDVTATSGLAGLRQRGMGVAVADFNGDERLDVYVTNDGEPNTLWINQGGGRFVDDAVILGAAVNADGEPEASMGVVAFDADDDGDQDLLLTHLASETNTFYRNDNGFFSDATNRTGIAAWSRPDTGFGLAVLDVNRDGEDDIVVANGGVMRPTSPADPKRPYAEPDRLALGQNGRWRSVPFEAEPAVSGPRGMSRSLAAGDLDGDGVVDLVIASNRDPVRVLRGRAPDAGGAHWVGLRLQMDGPNRDAIGARVRLTAADGRIETRIAGRHTGYLSSHDPVMHIGLGQSPGQATGHDADASIAEVRWPDGRRTRHEGLVAGTVHRIHPDAGTPIDAAGNDSSASDSAADSGPAAAAVIAGAGSDQPAASADTPAGPAAASRADASIPPLPIRSTPDGPVVGAFDHPGFAAACLALDLPAPPPVAAVDAAAMQAIHAAVEAVAAERSVATLLQLASVYDGNAVDAAAEVLYRELVDRAPERGDLLALHGRSLSRLERPAEAEPVLAAAAVRRPGDAAVHFRLGQARMELGDLDGAAEAFRRTAEIRPADGLGEYGLGRVAAELGRWGDARGHLERAVAARADLRGAWLLLAQAAARSGDAAAARSASTTAASIEDRGYISVADPLETQMYQRSGSTAALQSLLKALVDAARFDDAERVGRELLERRPRDPLLRRNLTVIARGQRRPDVAIGHADILVGLVPDDGSAHALRAVVLRDAGRHDAALAAADAALAVTRPDLTAHTARVTILVAMRRFPEAIAACDAAEAALPNSLDPLLARATVFITARDMAGLRTTLERILERSPGHPWATQTLDQLNRSGG